MEKSRRRNRTRKNKIENRERYLENRARQKKMQSLENELEKMQVYKKELMEYFLEHYDNYRPEKVQDLEDVTRRINDKEELWLMLNTETKNS